MVMFMGHERVLLKQKKLLLNKIVCGFIKLGYYRLIMMRYIIPQVTTGLPLNFVCVGILNVFVHLTGVHIFHLDAIPVWALGNNTNVTFQNNTTAQWGR